MERSATGLVAGGPQPAAVGLYDRPADGQSHSDPFRLGGKKGSEEAIGVFCIDSRAGILDRYEKLTLARKRGSNQEQPGFRIKTGNGLNPIYRQVQNDLLQLNPVATYGRNAGDKFGSQQDFVPLGLMMHQRNGVLDHGIHVD